MNLKKIFALFLSVALTACMFFVPTSAEAPVGESLIDMHAKFLGSNQYLNGNFFSQKDITLVYIWQTGCYNCIVSSPNIQLANQFYNDHPEYGVQILGVALMKSSETENDLIGYA